MCCCGEAVWRLGQQQHARSLFLLPWVPGPVCVLVCQQHCRLIPGVHHGICLWQHLVKVQSDTCKSPSCQCNCCHKQCACKTVVEAEIQLQWCELQKYQLCTAESTSSLTGQLEDLPCCQSFINEVKLIKISKCLLL